MVKILNIIMSEKIKALKLFIFFRPFELSFIPRYKLSFIIAKK